LNRDERIDAYLARAQPFARPILSHVRERVHAAIPAAEETLKWGAPAFTLGGKIVLIMAGSKRTQFSTSGVARNFEEARRAATPWVSSAS
jgi:uncharacterized protein YdhG (YjbR/CyaY superfamily)